MQFFEYHFRRFLLSLYTPPLAIHVLICHLPRFTTGGVTPAEVSLEGGLVQRIVSIWGLGVPTSTFPYLFARTYFLCPREDFIRGFPFFHSQLCDQSPVDVVV